MRRKKTIKGLIAIAVILLITYFVYAEIDAKNYSLSIYPDSDSIEEASYIKSYVLQPYTMDQLDIPDDIQDLLGSINVTVYGVNNATGFEIINWYMLMNSNNGWLICERLSRDTSAD